MSRVSALNRRGVGARKVDMGDLSNFVQKVMALKQPAHVGQVFAPDGGDSYWRREDGRILVEVETFPEGQDLTCRLGASSGGAGTGIWMIPRPGTIVGVVCPSGELDHYPYIAAVLDTGGAPERVSPDRAIWVADTPIEIETSDLRLGNHAASEPVPRGNAQKDALTTFTTALGAYATAIKAIADPSNAATPVLLTAITTLQAALVASLSQGVKVP